MSKKLIIMRGLPGSGKSTEAEELVKNGNYMRVNRDKLREMLHFNNWTPKNESVVIAAEYAVARAAFLSGYSVIVDDTNLTDKHISEWRFLADSINLPDHLIDVEIIDMMDKVSVSVCIQRDAAREKKVGRHVILDMALRYGYLKPRNVVICDIDGTVTDPTHRLQYARGPEKNWGKFFELLPGDSPRYEVYKHVRHALLDNDAQLIYVSARPEKYREATEKWLKEYGMDDHLHLLMRKNFDKRDDTIVKAEILRDYLSNANVVKVFDDRPKVIRMWREKGLDVVDVGDGIEF